MTAGPPLDKAHWRRLLLAGRRAVPAAVRAAEAHLLATAAVHACELVGGSTATVCAYVPSRGEPGSLAMLDALLATGRRVLVPLVPDGPLVPLVPDGVGVPPNALPSAGALGWATYLGPACLVDGPFGLREPAGPDLGPAACADAALMLVPALAVDRSGVRLGRGGGWYDRTLPLVRTGTPLLAVVRDDELVDSLPSEPHDVLMTGVLTPSAGPRTVPVGLH